ncbi:MAG: AAA family ATPase, partial [Acidothermaceae bacterium]
MPVRRESMLVVERYSTLVEREAALASLARYVSEAAAGQGRLVLVPGEAGVGKSALVEQLRRDNADVQWWWGACDGLFTPRPLGPLFDIADQMGGDLRELCLTGAAREQLFGALLRRLNDQTTLQVVVVEDIHWADEATLDLLRFLARRIDAMRVLLVVTYRDDGVKPADPLRVALGELAIQRATRRIDVAPLSVDGVRVLAGPTAVDVATIFRLTGGNPFYVTEVLRAGIAEVPQSARDAVLARAARLTGEAREALDAAALIGTRIEPPILESVTACSSLVIDELLRSGLLVDDAGWLGFRHEIARRAVEQAVGPHRRTAVHARILDALLQASYGDDARLAFHAEGAANASAVLLHAPRAARRAAELASHREAAAQYERALRFASGMEPADAAALYDALAAELSLNDGWHGAAD